MKTKNSKFISESIGSKIYVHNLVTGVCVARLCATSGEIFSGKVTKTIPKCSFKKFKELCQKHFRVTVKKNKNLLINEGWILKKIEWGFDLTCFKSAEVWEKILESLSISEISNHDAKRRYYKWSGKDITIFTGNNPITGEYGSKGQRGNEKGYASYIGIEGEEKQVLKLVKLIKKHGDIKDESPLSRDFI